MLRQLMEDVPQSLELVIELARATRAAAADDMSFEPGTEAALSPTFEELGVALSATFENDILPMDAKAVREIVADVMTNTAIVFPHRLSEIRSFHRRLLRWTVDAIAKVGVRPEQIDDETHSKVLLWALVAATLAAAESGAPFQWPRW